MGDYENFNKAMDTLLRADPKAVKAEMEREQREHAKERAGKGEKKRGKKTLQPEQSADNRSTGK